MRVIDMTTELDRAIDDIVDGACTVMCHAQKHAAGRAIQLTRIQSDQIKVAICQLQEALADNGRSA
jgi:hypothetical protein